MRVFDREASRKASLTLESTTIDDSKTPLKLPQFETTVMIAATRALELWRDEALEGRLSSHPPSPLFQLPSQ